MTKTTREWEKEFDELWQTNPATPEYSEYDNHKNFIRNLLQSVFEEIEREIDSIDHTRDGVCNRGYCDICGNDLISRGHNSAIVSMHKILDSLRQKYLEVKQKK